MSEPRVWGSGDGPIVAMDMDERDRLLLASQHTPHPGRVYDYYLGGNANYEVDRVFAKQRMAEYPDLQWLAWQNRQCLRRMVRHLLRQGVRQFVDLGSGLPTQGNVHEIADHAAPGQCSVVYVDEDPIAFAMAMIELEKHENRHAAVCGDITDAARVWPAVLSTGFVDLTKPIGLLMAAVLPFVPDSADPVGMTTFYRDQLPPGSFFALTHGTLDDMNTDHLDMATAHNLIQRYKETTASAAPRSRAQIMEFFGGWPLVDPGLVWTPLWQQPDDAEDIDMPDRDPSRSRVLAGMARKPY